MALDPTAMGYWKRALDASKAAAGAEKAERAHEHAMLRSRTEKHVENYKALIAIGQLDAWRQKQYLESGRTLDEYKSVRAFFKYIQDKLKTEEMPKNCAHNVIFFWSLLLAFGPLELKDGSTIARGALDKASWTTSVQGSKFAELSTLDFILNGGFADAFLTELCKQGHGVDTLDKKAKAMLNGTTDAPAKKSRRRSKKAASEPAETTEAAETTPPKAKAPARRPRRRGRRREDDDDDDDFAPPPKAKAQDDDEIETAAGEALAPAGTKTAELVDLMADNKMLQRDLATRDKEIADLKAAKQSEIAARDEELATTKAELAACKEQIKEKEADSEDLVKHSQDTIGALKFELAEVKNELARVKDEIAREKDKNKAGRRQTAVSPLCDATNV